MSDVALSRVQAAFDGYRAAGVEGLIEHIHPEFEGVVPPEFSAEPDTYIGHGGIRRYFALWEEQIDGLTFDATEIVDGDDDVVAVVLLITGRGRGSGVPVELRANLRVVVRDDLLVSMAPYATLDEALAA
jgi:ketosteroid isomerase-like protein